MEGWDSFLRSLKIAILVLQEMLESAAVSSSKAPKPAKAPCLSHPSPSSYNNAINESPGLGYRAPEVKQECCPGSSFSQGAVKSHMKLKFGAVYEGVCKNP